MRSRYAAFVLLDAPYLLRTWYPANRPGSIEFDPKLKWLGLKIVAARDTGADTAEVEFIARLRVGGASATRHHERSRFVREQDAWFYVDGAMIESSR